MRLTSLCLAISLCAFKHAAHADTIRISTLTDSTGASAYQRYAFPSQTTADTATGSILDSTFNGSLTPDQALPTLITGTREPASLYLLGPGLLGLAGLLRRRSA